MKQLLIHLSILVFIQSLIYAESIEEKHFKQANSHEWKEAFSPSTEENWQDHWFLDGEDARVSATKDYLEINTQDHQKKKKKIYAVLWTQPSFEGDIKITYRFKKPISTIRALILFMFKLQVMKKKVTQKTSHSGQTKGRKQP